MTTVQAVDITMVAGTVALIVFNVMNLLKPLVELIPGIMAPQNTVAHNSALQLLQWGLNFVGLLLVQHYAPGVYAGLHWWDLLVSASLQAGGLHVTYKLATRGKTDAPPLAVINGMTTAPAGVIYPSDAVGIPVVPRG